MRGTEQRQRANVETRKHEGRTVYYVTKTIAPNDELLCYFHVSSPCRRRVRQEQVVSKTKDVRNSPQFDENNTKGLSNDCQQRRTASKDVLANGKQSTRPSIYDNTPVKKPDVTSLTPPEVPRDAPNFSSPITTHAAVTDRIVDVINTSPSNTSDSNPSETSPTSLTSKHQSPVSETSADTSPLQITDTEPKLSPQIVVDEDSDDVIDHTRRDDVTEYNYSLIDVETNHKQAGIDVGDTTNSAANGIDLTVTATSRLPAFHSPRASYPHYSYDVTQPRDHERLITPRSYHKPTANTAVTPQRAQSSRNCTDRQLPETPRRALENSAAAPTAGAFVRRREKTWLPCEVCGKKFDRPSLLKRRDA